MTTSALLIIGGTTTTTISGTQKTACSHSPRHSEAGVPPLIPFPPSSGIWKCARTKRPFCPASIPPEHNSSHGEGVSTSNASGSAPQLSLPEEEDTRASILRRLDKELEAGNDSKALAIISTSTGARNGVRAFGSARQVPQRLYSLADLRLNNIETDCLLSPVDSTLGEVRRNLQIAAALGGLVMWQTLQLNQIQVLGILLALTLASGIDLVANNGGVEALLVDTAGQVFSDKYRSRVAQHEAGHFLIAYLLGVLPKGYTLSSLEALKKEGSWNVQAGTAFVDVQFQEEVKSGKLSSLTLNKYTCIALAGVTTEYLLFGLAEGGLSDIQQLDKLLKSLNFTQKKVDSQVRWAVLNTITILRRHMKIIPNLAKAMIAHQSIGQCIELIETELANVLEI